MDQRGAVVACMLIVFALVFLAGCVEKQFLPSEKEEIDRAFGIDSNNDGTFDQYFAFFKPKMIGNVTIKREIVSERKVGNVVTTTLRVFGNKTKSVSNIEIREVIPVALSRELDKINFETRYDEVVKKDPPFVVSWKFTLSGEEEVEKDFSYTTVVYQEINSEWLANEVSPIVEIDVINPQSNPMIVAFTSFNEGYMKMLVSSIPNYYVALAIYFSTLLCMIFVLYELFTLIAAFVSSMMKRTKFKDEIYRFIGHGRKSSIVWIIAGIGLIIVGSIICMVMQETEDSVNLEMIVRVASNPAMAVGIILFVIGAITLYTVVMDLIKGTIFGEKYFFEPIDIVKTRINDSKTRMNEMQEKIEECSSLGIGTETELLALTTHKRKIDSVEQSLDIENAEEYVPIVTRILSELESGLTEVEEKKSLYNNWPLWKESIDKILIAKDNVAPEDLLSVPEQWRRWSLTRYLSEHLGEALTIDNGMLTRMRIATVRKGEIDLILNELLGAGRIDGVALMRKDGLIIASNLPREIDANIIAAISAKVVANADMSSMELEKGKTRFVIIRSTGGENIIYSGKKIVLITMIKPGEATGFVVSGIEKIMEKLEPLF
jgi:predicted regulator of Ras-like GTPase activity (Roadblock/LC7/MglB family)